MRRPVAMAVVASILNAQAGFVAFSLQVMDTHFYAKERAFYVTKYVTKLLYECAGSDTDLDGCPAAVDVSASCESHMLDIAGYASERLWPAGAGNTRHCIDRLAQPDAEEARLTGVPICDDYGDNSGSYRSVEFMLELTGDDMTGAPYKRLWVLTPTSRWTSWRKR
jgi:hypothetical protein